ncbi:Darcynin 2 [Paenibacillus athensensis]|uniref:Darcynin 2 n=1 Tax=Paenibacillus athensensis TaxID=1967502 RepID=A0A4Y8Q574_9BACL|nr:darcynin family protein [Paenibacillus athensensis]MCD1259603.1 Darcynin 2 [Paenibacillus athensensis]
MTFCFVVLLEVDASWLALSREERRANAAGMYAAVARSAGKVQVRYFDADAFSGACTDFVVCLTDDLCAYHSLWEELKDSKPFAGGYLRIKDVVCGIENAFQAYETEVLGMERDAQSV